MFQLLQRVNLEELYPKFEREEVDMDAGGLPGLSGLVKDLHKEQGTNKQLRADALRSSGNGTLTELHDGERDGGRGESGANVVVLSIPTREHRKDVPCLQMLRLRDVSCSVVTLRDVQ